MKSFRLHPPNRFDSLHELPMVQHNTVDVFISVVLTALTEQFWYWGRDHVVH